MKFAVTLRIPATITKTLHVEADTVEQAKDVAMNFLSSDSEEKILSSAEESDWSDEDFDKREVQDVLPLDENGNRKEITRDE